MHKETTWMLLIALAAAAVLVPVSLGFLRIPAFLLEEAFVSGNMIIVGDVMLGREVERKMVQHGSDFPFVGTQAILKEATITLGNFEAAIPKTHVETPDFNFVLSVKKEFAEALKTAGFDVVSLANNHANDFGRDDLEHTRMVLGSAGVVPFGDPGRVDEFTTTVVTVGTTKVGLIGLHAVDREIATSSIQLAFNAIEQTSDIQIAYVHWGTEYKPLHNAYQQKLAYELIDAGIDAVIGHHPHVVQDVAFYEGKPVFYSLGNFIFDQYFSDAVQEGLMLNLSFETDGATYELIPVSSKATSSQPYPLSGEEKTAFLHELSLRSGLGNELISGQIHVPR